MERNHWSALDSGLNGIAQTLTVHANALYAGGSDAFCVASWDGANWTSDKTLCSVTPPPQKESTTVMALASFQGKLYATTFGSGSGFAGFWRKDATGWTLLLLGQGSVSRLAPGSAVLHVGLNGIRDWNGAAWVHLFNGNALGLDGDVTRFSQALAADQQSVYAGGAFTMAGHIPANNLARWDGTWLVGVRGDSMPLSLPLR